MRLSESTGGGNGGNTAPSDIVGEAVDALGAHFVVEKLDEKGQGYRVDRREQRQDWLVPTAS